MPYRFKIYLNFIQTQENYKIVWNGMYFELQILARIGKNG